MDIKDAKRKYKCHKDAAKSRNIDFLLTFDEWWDIWNQSGKWEERGRKRGQYCMSRYGDTGSYSADNVFIQPHGQNIKDANKGRIKSNKIRSKIGEARKGKKRPIFSDQHRQKISEARKKQFPPNKGRTFSEEHKQKIKESALKRAALKREQQSVQ